MRITSEAERASERGDMTGKQSHSAPVTTTPFTAYRARSSTGISGVYAATKPRQPPDTDGSIWGWATRIHFNPEEGFYVDDE